MSSQPESVQLELLFNRKIRDLNGHVVGRLEEVIGESDGDDIVVTEYHTGGMGLLEHLSAITIGSWLIRLLGTHRGYVIRWDQLDLSDPRHPRLTVARSELAERD